jgi:DNA-directed RNA polymerase specialized sigma24 family protein
MSLSSPTPPPHAVWLVLPEVERAIESTLRKRGVRSGDVEDHRQAVLERALETPRPPVNLAECIALVQTIATNLALDAHRQSASRAKVDVGPCEDPDERTALDAPAEEHLIDARRQLASLARDIETGKVTPRQAALLERVVVDDLTQVEAAAQFNLAPQTVRNEISAARKTARASWVAYTAAALLCGLVLIFYYENESENVAAIPPAHLGPDTSQDRNWSPTERHANKLRADGLFQCEQQHWSECIKDLDEAKSLDPAGDSDPQVQEARAAYRKMLDDTRSPSQGTDTPKKP